MSASVIIDLVITAVLVVSMAVGWSRGMVHGLLTLVGTILALVVAAEVADVASDIIVEEFLRPATHAAIEERVETIKPEDIIASPLEELARAIDAIKNNFIREEAGKLLDSFRFSAGDSEELVQDKLLSVGIEIADAALRGPVREVISAVIAVVCFAILSIALRPVVWMVEKAFELPLLRQVNQLGGLVSGTLSGILLVLVAVWALRLFGLWITEEVIEHSMLLPVTVDFLDSIGLSPASVSTT